MTALQWIVKEAKSIKKKYPKRFSKWTEYVAQASAIYASKHKGKSPVGKKKAAPKKKAAKKKLGKVTLKKANYHPRDERYIIMNDGVPHLEGKPFFKETAKDVASALRKVKAKRKAAVKKVSGVRKHKKISEQSILNKIHRVKEDVNKLDEAQHKHMMGTIKKNFKNFIQYKKHIIDVVVTPSGKKMYFASVHPLSMPFSTTQLSIAKKWIDKHIAIKRIKSSK
jgi:hypothetical protein